MSLKSKLIRFLTVLVVVVLLVAAGCLIFMCNKAADLVLIPRRTPVDEYHKSVMVTPEKFGFGITPFSLRPEEGVEIKALFLEPHHEMTTARRQTFAAQLKSTGNEGLLNWSGPRGTLLLLHGRNSIKEHWFPVAERLCAIGYNIILADSRAHGATIGGYCTYGEKEASDAQSLLREAAKLHGDLGPVSVIGYSLGGAIASRLITLDPQIKSAVIVSVFSSLQAVTDRVGEQRYGSLAGIAMPVVKSLVKLRGGFDMDTISPLVCAGQITIPTMVVHGTKDSYIPISHGNAIYGALAAPQKRWIEIPSAAHADLFTQAGESLYVDIAVWISGHTEQGK